MKSDGSKWQSKGELQAAQSAYQRDWWRDDPGVSRQLELRAELRVALEAGPIVVTAQVYKEGFRRWHPKRSRLHETLVEAQLGSGSALANPTAYFTIGSMAAGKTSRLRPIVHAHRRATEGAEASSLSRIAADEVREALPEYRDGLGSTVVEQECFDLTYDLVYPAARDAGLDLVYDTIGTVDATGEVSFGRNLRELKARGYAIHVLLAQAPLEVCKRRAERRALAENGRLVDSAAHDYLHPQPRRAFDLLRAEPGLLDGWAVFDTSSDATPAPIIEATANWLDWYERLRPLLLSRGL